MGPEGDRVVLGPGVTGTGLSKFPMGAGRAGIYGEGRAAVGRGEIGEISRGEDDLSSGPGRGERKRIEGTVRNGADSAGGAGERTRRLELEAGVMMGSVSNRVLERDGARARVPCFGLSTSNSWRRNLKSSPYSSKSCSRVKLYEK